VEQERATMLTGRQYKESLKDGRKVYFEGRLIEDFRV
jgi:4-hydroxybutyryl-CoA dehydratase / vinylacetyl-CoA-Delta-isomerase